MNHENTVIVPGGWNQIVAVTGDDTFSAPSSQFYMYLAASADDLLADRGNLYAFRVTATHAGPLANPADPFNGANDYGEIAVGQTWRGEFIPVPRNIALGDQTALESWSNANNVFQFIRVEDMATDKNNARIVYIADTGEPRAIPDAATGRLRRGPSGTAGPYPNGRIFKMVLNAGDPRIVDSFSILVNGDAAAAGVPSALHNPDNIDTSPKSLMIQEDPGSQNQFNAGAGPAARIWRYDLTTGSLTAVAEVNQALDPAARLGVWESSGIVDVSSVFGPGTWLVDVQAHSLFVESEVRTITDPATNITGPVTFKREGGQLLRLTVPGS
jgi:hypothetical protein